MAPTWQRACCLPARTRQLALQLLVLAAGIGSWLQQCAGTQCMRSGSSRHQQKHCHVPKRVHDPSRAGAATVAAAARLAGTMPGAGDFVELCHVSRVLHECGMRTAAGQHRTPLQPSGDPSAFHQTDRALVHVTTSDGALPSLLDTLSLLTSDGVETHTHPPQLAPPPSLPVAPLSLCTAQAAHCHTGGSTLEAWCGYARVQTATVPAAQLHQPPVSNPDPSGPASLA
jgi:hypothetical protein